MTRNLLVAALLLQSVGASACPLCLGAGQTSKAQQLVTTPQAVLALPTADAGRFRVIHVIKGERPASGTVEGGYPRTGPAPGDAKPTDATPLLLVRDDPLPTWVVLGAIDAARADWLRALATGKRAAEMSPEEWRARVALVVPHLNDPESLATELATAELAAAPYAALRTAKPLLDAAALRRCLADPALAARQPLCLLLLGIAGNAQDAAALEERLQSGNVTNLSAMLAADLELRGAARVAWIEPNYLADPKRSTPEIKAALLALSVHGNASSIPRERVIQSYRVFMKAHPEIAGEVAPDLAIWKYWDAVPDYVALMRSSVRQQFPSRLAIQAYLQQNPNAGALAASPEAATAGAKADRSKPIAPMKRLLREPLFHFLLIGAALFAAYRHLQPTRSAVPSSQEIQLSVDELSQLAVLFQSQWKHDPTTEEFRLLVEQKVQTEVLYREGLAMGLDKNDEIVKRRMAQKMQFLAEEEAAAHEPTTEELKAWYAKNSGKFAMPKRVSFRHLYFSPDRRGKNAQDDAAKALSNLTGQPVDTKLDESFSDPFMFQQYYRDRAVDYLGKEFGPQFAQAITKIPTGSWQGPIESGFGWHLVFVDTAIPGRVPDFEEIETDVKTAWLSEQKMLAWDKAYKEMRGKYTVLLPSPPKDTNMSPPTHTAHQAAVTPTTTR